MPRLVRKADDLILDGRAVARADALDLAAVERRAVEVFADDLVGFARGIGQIADRLIAGRPVGVERERDDLLLALLHLETGKVDRTAVDARRGAGLEPLQAQAEPAQRLGQRLCRRKSVRAALAHIVADDDAPAEEGARGDNDRLGRMARADRGHDRADRAVFGLDRDDLVLHEPQVFLLLKRVLHIGAVFDAVGLGAQGVHRRAFASVEHAVLDAGHVRRARHLAAQRVDLAHQMPLGRAADRGVAGHVADCVQIDREARRVHPEPGRGQRSLDARVPRADDDNVKRLRRKPGH